MKQRHKIALKINLVSLFFIAVSSISVTLAWFAYSGLSSASTVVDVKAWYIEFEKDNTQISNEIVISLADIYPGMETVNEVVNIKNLGDSDAKLDYSIEAARILDINNYSVNERLSSLQLEDILSHNYPFHINMVLSKDYISAKTDVSTFEVSISWPLDSGDNDLDSYWGNEAYLFQKEELRLKGLDNNYQVRSSINVEIKVTAEQYIESEGVSDINFALGSSILYDAVNNVKCGVASSTCLETTVVDMDNGIGEEYVTLLPDVNSVYTNGSYSNYDTLYSNLTSGWLASKRGLLLEDVLKIIALDIDDTVIVSNNLSDVVVGSLKDNNRLNEIVTDMISKNGYVSFLPNKFSYLNTDSCYWINTNFNNDNAFAVSINQNKLKLGGELKSHTCKVISLLRVKKEKLLVS